MREHLEEEDDAELSRETNRLPRLVYIGDVPIEESVAGSLVLYRLFQSYAAGRLTIVELGAPSHPERSLREVPYVRLRISFERLTRTRFRKLVLPFHYMIALSWHRVVEGALRRARPEAVVTVPHGPGWLVAVELARKFGVPLHLIVHDHHWNGAGLPVRQQRWLERRFSEAYKQACSRFCVSARMERAYRFAYGASGVVLYPSAPRGRQYDVQKIRGDIAERRPQAWAFFGAIFYDGMARLLSKLVDLLAARGAHLELYGPRTTALVRSGLLGHSAVVYRGMLSPADVGAAVSRTADVLVLPFSFDPMERMELSFPSKLVDYTAVGLPILTIAPPNSAVAEWVREHPESALLVTKDTSEALALAISRLSTEPELRLRLARGAVVAGANCFSHDKVFCTFAKHVARCRAT